MNFSVVQDLFLSVDGIVAVHNLRIWGLTTDKTALSAHLAIKPGSNAQAILKEASICIRQKYDIYEMTLQGPNSIKRQIGLNFGLKNGLRFHFDS